MDTRFYLWSNPELSVCKFIQKRWIAHGLLVITGWQVASLVCLAPVLARGHEARIPESLSAPTGLEGSETPWVAYSLLLPTEQLAAGQGWLRNLSVTAKLSFTALRVWVWGGPHRARQAPAVRGVGGHPQKALGSSHHASCRVFLFHWTVLQSKELENSMINGFIIAQWPFGILDLLCHCLQPSSNWTSHILSP